MMIVEDILLAAQPALKAILTPKGLEHTVMDVVTTKGEPIASSTIISEDLLLRVFVYDEEMGFWLCPPEGASGFTARLRSELQDFVAESGFGWGELRGSRPAERAPNGARKSLLAGGNRSPTRHESCGLLAELGLGS